MPSIVTFNNEDSLYFWKAVWAILGFGLKAGIQTGTFICTWTWKEAKGMPPHRFAGA